jgi:protein-S-isoprenylcysteine O-methyltransferase Ste14
MIGGMIMSESGSPVPFSVWLKRSFQILLIIVIMDGILFGAAGRLDWFGAWLLTGLYLAFLLVVVVWTSLKAPGLMEERSHRAGNVKPWDKIIINIYTILLLALLVTAGLDAGRFRWSSMPFALQVLGVLVLALTGIVIGWVMSVNYYLSRYARIQDDRGQQVVTEGPYRFVRHPMYAMLPLFMAGIALVLGSWWALVPGSLIGVLYIIRTALEDRMLQEELPGYSQYAQKVRYRLFPGIW